MKHEQDYLLALTVARLVEGNATGENFRWVLEEHVMPLASNELHSPWLLSIAHWLLGNFVGSMQALLQLDSSGSSGATAPRRYALVTQGADLDPVITYYTEHLLSSTAELAKYGQLDQTADVRLRRKVRTPR